MTSHLEEKFKRYWQQYAPEYPLVPEYRDKRIKGKRNTLPFDFLIEGTNILIEIQGATHRSNTGHTSARGIKRDCIKSMLAQMNGYLCFQLTASMITHDKIQELATYVRQKHPKTTTADRSSDSRRRSRKSDGSL